MTRWYSITDPTWNALVDLAAERDRRSATATNTRPWNPQFNLLGLIGEALYAKIASASQNGSAAISDGGCDFPGVDCKATPHFRSPRLLRLATDPLKAAVYFLVAVDLANRRARPAGYATRQMLAVAPLVEYGHGPTRTLPESELLTADQLIPRLFADSFVGATS